MNFYKGSFKFKISNVSLVITLFALKKNLTMKQNLCENKKKKSCAFFFII